MILDSINNPYSGSYLIWAYPGEDFNINSVLTVNPGEEAIFVKNGEIVNVFANGRYELKTENYPFVSGLRNSLSHGESTFKCKILFVSLNQSQQVLWGTDSPILLRDPVQHIATKVVGRGSYRVKVVDGTLLVTKLIGMGTATFAANELQKYFCNQLQQHIKTEIAHAIANNGKEVLETCADLNALASMLSPIISDIFIGFGIALEQFSISGLDIPDGDPSRELLEQAYAKSRELDILGENYGRIKSTDILTNLSQNEGTGTFAGAGIALGLGGKATSAIGELLGTSQQSTSNDDVVSRLSSLKELLAQGLISEEDYARAKQEVIAQIIRP